MRHGFLLLPNFSLLSLGGALDALAAVNQVLDEAAHAGCTLSLDGRPVQAACGTTVAASAALAAAAPTLDALHVVADLPLPDGTRDDHRALHAALQAAAAAGRLLGGIGTGAAVLAQAGVLAGHRATLHWAHVAQLADAHVQVVVSSNVYEIDRGRLTCTGGHASLDMFIAWLGQRHGERIAHDLMAHFGLERLRARDERQRAPLALRIGSGTPRLAEAVALMEANLGEPLPTDDIARLVGVSRRQLERLFKQHLDELPSRYYAELRLARARRLLQQTSQSILQVGLSCGFSSGSHFSNAYRARFGRTPRDERGPLAAAWRQRAPLENANAAAAAGAPAATAPVTAGPTPHEETT